MKKFLTYSSLLLLGLTTTTQAEDSLTLSNGDIIKGNILEISKENTLFLEHPNTPDTIEIDSTKLKKVLLNQQGNRPLEQEKAVLTLVNGDQLSGILNEINSEFITFQSTYAGSFNIPKSNVKNIKLGSAINQPVYKFSSNKSLFKQNKGWLLHDNSIVSKKGAIMWQKFNLLKSFSIKFDAEWKLNSPQITLHLGADKPLTTSKNNRYQVLIQRRHISVTRPGSSMPNPMGPVTNHRLTNHNAKKAKFEILVSRLTGDVTVYINDKKIKTFRDKTGKPPSGQYFGIQNSSQSNELQISNLELSSWDGKTILEKSLTAALKAKLDLLESGFDQFTGQNLTVTKSSNGSQKWNFKNKYLTLNNKDFSKASAIYFPNKLIESKAIQSSLNGGNNLRLQNVILKDNLVHANHAILGKIKISRSNFISLALN